MSKISIVIPVHGDCPYLQDTLDSIYNQDFEDFEILIVLDRASFSTTQLISRQNPGIPIRQIKSETPGIVSALNLGVENAQSELIARLDADDLMMANRLLEQYNFMINHPEVGCVGSNIMLIDEHGNEMYVHRNPKTDRAIKKTLEQRTPLAHPSVMYRKSIVKALGGYRNFFTYAEDYDLWARMSEVTEMHNLQLELTKYRVHKDQVSKKRTEIQSLAVLATRTSIRLRKKGLPDLPDIYSSVEVWAEVNQVVSNTNESLVNWLKNLFVAQRKNYLKPRWKDLLRTSFQNNRKLGNNFSASLIFMTLLIISPLRSTLKFYEWVSFHLVLKNRKS